MPSRVARAWEAAEHAQSLARAAATDNTSPLAFPADFQFGTALAGFQADMGCPTLPRAICEDDNSDWFAFTTDIRTTSDWKTFQTGQHPSDVGPGHWELYTEDIRLADEELANDSLRFGLEWSRIFPVATDGVEGYQALRDMADQDALAHYHAELAALRARGMRPFVTINHYTLPLWIHDGVGCHVNLDTCSPKGWVDKDRTVREIAKFAGFVAREFGAEVDQWATLNEPLAILMPGFLVPAPERTNPPAVFFEADAALTVFAALVEAHARMYDAVKANDAVDADRDGEASRVGVVYAMSPVKPLDPENRLDRQAARNVFYLWNMAYLNAVALGDFDADLDGEAVHREDLANRMDFIGINYYTRITVGGLRFPVLPRFSPLTTFNPFELIGWEDYPMGLYEMATVVYLDLNLPSVISETGTPVEAGAEGETYQSQYLMQRLAWSAQATTDGIPLEGFFWWTLTDNYEWNHGMDLEFGLYDVDPDDAARVRTPRMAVDVYAGVASTGILTEEDLATWFPEGW